VNHFFSPFAESAVEEAVLDWLLGLVLRRLPRAGHRAH
jgi:hypothetical protein